MPSGGAVCSAMLLYSHAATPYLELAHAAAVAACASLLQLKAVLRTCCRKRMQTAYCGSRQQDPIISSLATPQLSRAVTRVSPHAATMANKDAAPADSDTVTWHMQCRLSKLPMANCTQLQGCHVQGYWPQHSTATPDSVCKHTETITAQRSVLLPLLPAPACCTAACAAACGLPDNLESSTCKQQAPVVSNTNSGVMQHLGQATATLVMCLQQ